MGAQDDWAPPFKAKASVEQFVLNTQNQKAKSRLKNPLELLFQLTMIELETGL